LQSTQRRLKRNKAVTKMSRGKRTYLSAIDAGFRWTAVHRKVEAEVKSEVPRRYAGGVNSPGYGWSMFRAASRYRHFWQSGGVNGYGIHLTPRGTYFRLNGNSNERHLSGGYLRADGTLGTFDGRHNYPLYCVGCGRADLRVPESSDCAKEIYVPAELLITIPESSSAVAPTIAQREERAWRLSVGRSKRNSRRRSRKRRSRFHHRPPRRAHSRCASALQSHVAPWRRCSSPC
jgi:hypothetical protein